MTCACRGGYSWAGRLRPHGLHNKVSLTELPVHKTKSLLLQDHQLAICKFFLLAPASLVFLLFFLFH